MAQAIADAIKAPTFDISSEAPSVVADYDVVIFGTPVEGARPAKETLAWAEQLPSAEGKKSILFCTYRLWVAGTFKKLDEVLSTKGYTTILEVQKRNVKQGKTDFSDVLEKVKQKIQ